MTDPIVALQDIILRAVFFDIDCAGPGESDAAREAGTAAGAALLARARTEGHAQGRAECRAEMIAALRDWNDASCSPGSYRDAIVAEAIGLLEGLTTTPEATNG